jgi:hypothetical protein
MGGMWAIWIETCGWFLLIGSNQVIVGHCGQIGCPTVVVTVLLQSLDRTNIQAMARNTICIGQSPTTLPKHSVGRMKGEAMDMITIHTTVLGTTPPQHSVFHTDAQAMAMTTVHTTLRGMILTYHLVWCMKGEVMAMTTDRIIQLLTSLPPRSVMPMNSQATTLTTIRIIVSQTALLQISAYMWPHAIGRRKSTRNSLRKRPDRAKLIIRESLRKITASIVRNGTRFITSTLVRHLVRVGPTADLMRQTLTRTTSDSWRSLQRQYKACSHTDVGIPQRTILYFGKDFL